MSASLARRVFKPTPAVVVRSTARTTCPVSRFLPAGTAATTSGASSVSTRTVNAVAHLTVGAALFASAITVLTHPDSLLFDHPPRSAISWTPERHLASRKLHAAATTTAHRPPTGPAHPPSSLSAGPSPAPTIAAPSFTGSRVVTAVAGTDWHWELRLAGVLGRSLAGQ